MTRNNDEKLEQLREAIPVTPNARENAALADAHKHALRSPLMWASVIHRQLISGMLAPIGGTEGALRVRSMLLAIRRLEPSTDPKHAKQAQDLRKHLRSAWGLKRAADAVGGHDRDAHRELIERWGDDQLPPAGAIVGGIAADERLVAALVRRVSG